jgi:hypothetical protein
MKKVVALLMILVMSTTLFAAPVSAVGSLEAQSREITRAGQSTQTDTLNDADNLFANVQAVALTTARQVKLREKGLALDSLVLV